ncbi:Flp pilus assembly protein TadD [Azospirillum agricola]|uniref:tetratricopeptide repeat protein n=1 Tax=Azospirillum agricola TaxID=1720247 RepID=UPI001AE4968F|nr:tetratricopeptide repeat protein [Azospirillum agricola]MBP2232621.1 Flp pilus assembly protein TadD [Azospirillum agricola]
MPTIPPPRPIPIEEAAALAALHHREGRLEEALALYGPLQAARPTDPTANALLGTVLAQLDRPEEAVAFLRQAARLAPDEMETLNNLALALGASGRTREAADAWNQLGTLLYTRRRHEQAMGVFETALSVFPSHLGAAANLGATLQALGRHAEAVDRLDALLAGSPEEAEAHNNLGNAQMGAGDVEAAIVSYRRAIALRLDYFEAYSNLGLALAERRPGDAPMEGGTAPEAAADLPSGEDVAGTLVNLGNARGGLDPTLGVRECYEKALELRPDFPPAHWNLGLCLLLNGDFAQGWKEYEWRWRWSGFGEENRPFAQPVWQGEPPLAVGGTLLVTAEQGLGDTLQFARYLPLLVERGFDVVFEVQVPVFTLLWHSLGRHGVRVVPRAETPARVHDDLPFTRHVPLMSLPERFGTRLETIPDTTPYLFAEPTRKALWARRLDAAAGLRRKVGIAWKGRPLHARDRERSIPAAVLAPLLTVADTQFFAVQKHESGTADTPTGVIPLDGLLHDFSETAAVVANLDLVITVDTSVAHLAGAMGVPVWVMLPFSPDWRWLLDRDDSPWYPTMTLFRQRRAGDWDGVVAEIAHCLSDTGRHTSIGQGIGQGIGESA